MNSKKYYEDNKEKIREYRKKYYQKNKEKIAEINKKWRENNKDKFYRAVYRCRKRKALELKEKGLMFCWKTDKERQKLMEERNARLNK